MKWKKLGFLFDPSSLVDDFAGFAQSPQALVLEDRVRIYFSTRKKTPNGKYISHIQYAEFDKGLKKLLNVSKHEVIKPGKLGCFDEHGIFPMNVFKHREKILGFTCGWSRRVSVSVETGIGLAESKDNGVTFNRIGDGPILTSSLNEPFLVGDPFVKHYNGFFHMWYIFGTRWKQFPGSDIPERIYKIGHAISTDAKEWKKEGLCIISDVFSNECQALPTVIELKGTFHMLFCFRHASDFRSNSDRSYRIGYASSTDLKKWVRDDMKAGIDVSKDGWDSKMLCYPHVFTLDDKVYLLYNGNEFGRYGFGLAELGSI